MSDDRGHRKYDSATQKRKEKKLKCIREKQLLNKKPKLTSYFNRLPSSSTNEPDTTTSDLGNIVERNAQEEETTDAGGSPDLTTLTTESVSEEGELATGSEGTKLFNQFSTDAVGGDSKLPALPYPTQTLFVQLNTFYLSVKQNTLYTGAGPQPCHSHQITA